MRKDVFVNDLQLYMPHVIHSYIDSVDYEFQQSFEDREKYVGNPINAFSLVRRTHQDLPKWHNYSQQIVGMGKSIYPNFKEFIKFSYLINKNYWYLQKH